MHKITLKEARNLRGYSLEAVAEYCKMNVEEIEEYEKDAGKIPARIMMLFHNLYKISLDLIQF